MKLALFNLDHTLLDADSDCLWGQFLVRKGAVDGLRYARENARYHADYRAGRLDIHEFPAFGLRSLADNQPQQLGHWRRRFLQESVLPCIADTARTLLGRHRDAGHVRAIITATNRFITEPIAATLGVPHLIATEPEHDGSRFTGRVAGTPCFREGKVTRLKECLYQEQLAPRETWFHSDSHNDLPLLQTVDHPVAVNPGPLLAQTAAQRGWPVMHVRRTTHARLN